MADFAWGLQERGHIIQVLSSNAPYLGPNSSGPSGEQVDRRLKLKGSFQDGVHHLQDSTVRLGVDSHNRNLLSHWLQHENRDGILLGNLDLLGPELLEPLVESKLPLLHHIGFVTLPYPPEKMPPKKQPLPGSHRKCNSAALPQRSWNEGRRRTVVYPGARLISGAARLRRPLPPVPDGTTGRPLRVCFAGLQMGRARG